MGAQIEMPPRRGRPPKSEAGQDVERYKKKKQRTIPLTRLGPRIGLQSLLSPMAFQLGLLRWQLESSGAVEEATIGMSNNPPFQKDNETFNRVLESVPPGTLTTINAYRKSWWLQLAPYFIEEFNDVRLKLGDVSTDWVYFVLEYLAVMWHSALFCIATNVHIGGIAFKDCALSVQLSRINSMEGMIRLKQHTIAPTMPKHRVTYPMLIEAAESDHDPFGPTACKIRRAIKMLPLPIDALDRVLGRAKKKRPGLDDMKMPDPAGFYSKENDFRIAVSQADFYVMVPDKEGAGSRGDRKGTGFNTNPKRGQSSRGQSARASAPLGAAMYGGLASGIDPITIEFVEVLQSKVTSSRNNAERQANVRDYFVAHAPVGWNQHFEYIMLNRAARNNEVFNFDGESYTFIPNFEAGTTTQPKHSANSSLFVAKFQNTWDRGCEHFNLSRPDVARHWANMSWDKVWANLNPGCEFDQTEKDRLVHAHLTHGAYVVDNHEFTNVRELSDTMPNGQKLNVGYCPAEGNEMACHGIENGGYPVSQQGGGAAVVIEGASPEECVFSEEHAVDTIASLKGIVFGDIDLDFIEGQGK